MTPCTNVIDGALPLLDHIWSLGITSKLAGYLIHSHRYTSTKPTKHFWNIQSQIVTQLCVIWALSIVVAFVHPEHDSCAVSLHFKEHYVPYYLDIVSNCLEIYDLGIISTFSTLRR